MHEYNYYVYLLANNRRTVIYTGVTNDIYGRMLEHKDKINKKSFTSKYNVDRLVYYEEYDNIGGAIDREKQIKNYSRQNKIKLVEEDNSNWDDLTKDWYNSLSPL